jgi:hypothetical protein
VWCVPALRVPLVHSLNKPLSQKTKTKTFAKINKKCGSFLNKLIPLPKNKKKIHLLAKKQTKPLHNQNKTKLH